MFGLSLGHLVILTVVVLLFGHRRLPELGYAFGRGLGAFKRGLDGKDVEESPNPELACKSQMGDEQASKKT